MADPVYFWQRIVSPHMAGLAAAMAAAGRDVTYVAERTLSADRAAQGWQVPSLGQAKLELAPDEAAVRRLVKAAPAESVHICQGLRNNQLVGIAQSALASRGLRQWVIMETVDDRGWRGVVKRLEYRRLLRQWSPRLEGIPGDRAQDAGLADPTGHAAGEGLFVRLLLPESRPEPRRVERRATPFASCLSASSSPAKGWICWSGSWPNPCFQT